MDGSTSCWRGCHYNNLLANNPNVSNATAALGSVQGLHRSSSCEIINLFTHSKT